MFIAQFSAPNIGFVICDDDKANDPTVPTINSLRLSSGQHDCGGDPTKHWNAAIVFLNHFNAAHRSLGSECMQSC
jgi:hypothetical protein